MAKYKKNFNTWNKRKKKIHLRKQKKFYFHEREVWWCALGVNIGFEQDGKGMRYARPVVILKRYGGNACLIVPLTSQSKYGKYYFSCGTIAGKNAIATLSQIRFVDRRRLLDKVAVLQKSTYVRLVKKIIHINFQK